MPFTTRPCTSALRRRTFSVSGSAASIIALFAAVGCALASQYAIKHLIDVLGEGRHHPGPLWGAFAILVGLIAADSWSKGKTGL